MGCVHIVATVNNAAVNMGTQIPVGIESWKSLLSILLGLDLGVELLDRTVTVSLFEEIPN